jgi:hypothetical protein
MDKPTDAAVAFVRGKSAHQLLALIASGELPKGVTPADVGKADVARVAAKAEARADKAA